MYVTSQEWEHGDTIDERDSGTCLMPRNPQERSKQSKNELVTLASVKRLQLLPRSWQSNPTFSTVGQTLPFQWPCTIKCWGRRHPVLALHHLPFFVLLLTGPHGLWWSGPFHTTWDPSPVFHQSCFRLVAEDKIDGSFLWWAWVYSACHCLFPLFFLFSSFWEWIYIQFVASKLYYLDWWGSVYGKYLVISARFLKPYLGFARQVMGFRNLGSQAATWVGPICSTNPLILLAIIHPGSWDATQYSCMLLILVTFSVEE